LFTVKKNKYFIFIIFLVLTSDVFSQKLVDGVVAVVGNRSIFQSDVLQLAQTSAIQSGVDLNSNYDLLEKYLTISLENIINQMVVLYAAEEDTSIIVSDDELDLLLSHQIEEMLVRAGSKDNLENIIGQPLRIFKNDYRENLYDMVLVDKYKQSIFQKTNITRNEILEFYNTYKDSIPLMLPKTKYGIIQLPITPGDEVKDSVLYFSNSLKDSLDKGIDFSYLAITYSEDPGSGKDGGNLGFIHRGTLVNKFEEAAFSLDINEISAPVLTEYGYHIIQLLEKRGEKIHVRHILRTLEPSEIDYSNAQQKIQKVFEFLQFNHTKFDSIATFYSKKYNNYSGIYDWTINSTIEHWILDQINNSDQLGILFPFEYNRSYSIININDKKIERQPDIEVDWNYIKEFALNKKINSKFISWINNKKDDIFIKIY